MGESIQKSQLERQLFLHFMHFQGSSEVNIVDFLHWTLYNSKMEMLNMLADAHVNQNHVILNIM